MKQTSSFIPALAILPLLALAVASFAAPEPKTPRPAAPKAPPAAKPNFALVNTLKVGGEGPWESATLDPQGKFLYVPRVNRTQVIDTSSGKVVAEIAPGAGAKAVALAPEANRGFITNARDASVTVFDLKTNEILGKLKVLDDPGAIVYDPLSKHVLVGCWGPKSLIPFPADIDLKTGRTDPPIVLEGPPKSMVADGQGMVYVTVPEKGQIAVIDTRVMKLATTWPAAQWPTPVSIAMDRLRSRLFIAGGPRFSILSAADGHDLGNVTINKPDALRLSAPTAAFYDGHAFEMFGDALNVIGQNAEGRFEVQQTLTLEPGAGPPTIDSRSGKIYLPSIEYEGRKPIPGTFKILVVEKK